MVWISAFENLSPSSYLWSQDTPWDQLVSSMEEPEITKDKTSVPLLVFAKSLDPASRRKEHITHATLGAWDVDGVDPDSFKIFLQSLRDRGIEHATHTTFSHLAKGDDLGRYRLFVPLSRDITQGEWRMVRRQLTDYLFTSPDVKPDKACHDIGRMYYVPASHPDRIHAYEFTHHAGAFLDVDKVQALAALSGPSQEAPEANRTLTATDIKAFLPRYRRRKGFRGDIADALKAVLAGDEYAPPGDRERVTRDLTWILAAEYPDATPESLEALFTPSLALMESLHPSGALEPSDVSLRFSNAVDKIQSDKSSKLRPPSAQEAILLSRVWGTPRGPASDQEIEDDAQSLQMSVHEYLTSGLILRINGQTLVRNLPHKRYDTFGRDEALGGCEQLLVAIPQVEFMKQVGDQIIPKSLNTLTKEYGRILQATEYDISAPATYVDTVSETLCLSPCPPVPLVPAYDTFTAEWLEIIGGDTHHLLLDWLSKYPDLDQPLPALYLEGAPNTGKSLFAMCLASMYGNGKPIDAEDVLGDQAFNQVLVQNPLVFADEYFPQDRQGNPNTHLLRKFIQERSKALRKKFAHPTIVKGCHRVVIAANHGDALTFKTGVALTQSDITALEDRLIHIHTPNRSAVWLKDKERSNEFHSDYLERKTFARHVLWLQENHKSDPKGRFWVAGHCPDLVNKMATTGDISDGICEILVRSLLSLEDMAKTQGAVMLHYDQSTNDVHLAVIPKGISECWGSFRLATRRPTPTQVNRVLGALKDGGGRLTSGTTRHRLTYVSLSRLCAYADQAGLGQEDLLDAFVAKASPLLPS